MQVTKELRMRDGLPEPRNSSHSGTRKLGAAGVIDYAGDIVGQLSINQLQAFA